MKSLKTGKKIARYVICKYHNNISNGCVIYDDGYCEMVGRYTRTVFTGTKGWSYHCELTVPYKNTDYDIIVSGSLMNNDKLGLFGLNSENITVNSFDTFFYTSTPDDEIMRMYWKTEGFVDLNDPAVKEFINENSKE